MTTKCDMRDTCTAPVAYVDNKGFVYCQDHGIARKAYCSCRKLKPAEIKKLQSQQNKQELF